MMEKFNLYDEPRPGTFTGNKTTILPDSPLNNYNDESMVEIDISEPETLYTMSKGIREHLKDKPDDYELTVYLVCGNVPSKDAGLLADYLKDVVQPIVVAFRGIIHFDFIHLFINNTVYINTQSQVMYSKMKLHDTMKNFMIKPECFKKFMQRFVDEYWKLNEGNLLPISELKTLGIEFENL